MHQIKFNNITYNGPSEWNEFTPEQLTAYSALLLKTEPPKNIVKLLLCIVFRIPLQEVLKLKSFQITQLSPLVDYLQNGQNLLNNWAIPSLTIQNKTLFGPANKLSNITIREFRYLELYYNAWKLSQDQKYLNQLVACLYRPASSKEVDTDIREHLSEIELNKRALIIDTGLDHRTKHAILINYEGCRNFIFNKFSEWVFKKSKTEGEQTPSRQLFDYDVMIQNVAGAKFGNYKETAETLLYPFLEHFSNQIEQFEKSKSKK